MWWQSRRFRCPRHIMRNLAGHVHDTLEQFHHNLQAKLSIYRCVTNPSSYGLMQWAAPPLPGFPCQAACVPPSHSIANRCPSGGCSVACRCQRRERADQFACVSLLGCLLRVFACHTRLMRQTHRDLCSFDQRIEHRISHLQI